MTRLPWLALLLPLAACAGGGCLVNALLGQPAGCAGETLIVPLYRGPIDLSGALPVMPRRPKGTDPGPPPF